MEALDPSTGKVKWTTDLCKENGFQHSAITPDGTLLISGDICIWGIDTKDGRIQSAIGFKQEGYINGLKLNSDGTGFFLYDKDNGIQFIKLVNIEQEFLERASQSPEEKIAGTVRITEDEEFVDIDGMFLRRNI